jgi:putative ABC transport system substrate-binding protein
MTLRDFPQPCCLASNKKPRLAAGFCISRDRRALLHADGASHLAPGNDGGESGLRRNARPVVAGSRIRHRDALIWYALFYGAVESLMLRRDVIKAIGIAATVWPLAARAQQAAIPTVGFVNGSSPEASALNAAAFRKGLSETGYVEGQNVTVEYHWLRGQYDRLPILMNDLVRRQVDVIATPGSHPASLAAKAATDTIPIVFGVGEDPVKFGLVASLARPGGNATGINFFVQEVTAKRLALLRELIPKAARIGVLVNPANTATAEATTREAQEAARVLGLQLRFAAASTAAEIDSVFSRFAREPVDALLIAGDGFFTSRSGQFVTLAARDRLATSYSNRQMVDAGALMSYGTNITDMFRQVGVYVGSILRGAKPADLPTLQSTKFEFVINLQTAKALGINVPPMLLARADEVIE